MPVPTWQTLEERGLGVVEPAASTADDFAVRLLRRFLWLCESPRTRAAMLRMVRGSVGSARAGRTLYRVLNRVAVNPVARATGVQSSTLRLELVASQLIGLAMLRYVLEVEPMASATVDDVVALTAPSIRAALRG